MDSGGCLVRCPTCASDVPDYAVIDPQSSVAIPFLLPDDFAGVVFFDVKESVSSKQIEIMAENVKRILPPKCRAMFLCNGIKLCATTNAPE